MSHSARPTLSDSPEYEDGRQAGWRGEGLGSVEHPGAWIYGWSAGTRERLYREACVEAPLQQLVELQASGWTMKRIGRALHLSTSTVARCFGGRRPFRRGLAERIDALWREVKKAEELLLRGNKRAYEPSTEARGNGPTRQLKHFQQPIKQEAMNDTS